MADENTFDSELWGVFIGGSLILLACTILALWIQSSMWRQRKIRKIKNRANAERAALIVSNAKATAKGERELNEYLAHEVRNPLSASITACSFLSAAYQESKETYEGYDNSGQIHHDIGVISSSLEFMYGLLRSVLDMSRAADNHMSIEKTYTDILKDVLEPVKAMVYQDGAPFEIVVDCPENTVVMADQLRLKQIILNLTNNAKTFVERGYIRLEAKPIANDRLEMSVSDSGPGIPVSRRSQVFGKYQESLDQIQQGTGMGLSLCKKLAELMDGSIHLDETFQSGIEGCPGVRFVVTLENAEIASLPQPNSSSPMHSDEVVNSDTSLSNVDSNCSEAMRTGEDAVTRTLPEELSVLVVDDDMIVRKLLCRSLGRVSAPFQWSIQEASNGETAISLAQSNRFDVIFLDQYMGSSHAKQLLGTETAAELRRLGVTSRICGLSANDLEGEFLKAGADCFYLKPFPCEKEAQTHHLLMVLHG
jgi:signal transduction histidine kinase/CheY-like chemotaxis protein